MLVSKGAYSQREIGAALPRWGTRAVGRRHSCSSARSLDLRGQPLGELVHLYAESEESIPYRAITGFRTSSFITKDINLEVSGRRDSVDLLFKEQAERDRALEILNTHAL
jgi:hypothetical protein